MEMRKEMIRTCDPCQRFARNNRQDKVEISHSNMFNLFPGHTIHLDFCEFGGKDYILLVDRMTGYIGAEQIPNQGTDAALSAVKIGPHSSVIHIASSQTLAGPL